MTQIVDKAIECFGTFLIYAYAYIEVVTALLVRNMKNRRK